VVNGAHLIPLELHAPMAKKRKIEGSFCQAAHSNGSRETSHCSSSMFGSTHQEEPSGEESLREQMKGGDQKKKRARKQKQKKELTK